MRLLLVTSLRQIDDSEVMGMTENLCKKCGGEMPPSKAIASAYCAGEPDFPGDLVGMTMSIGVGAAKLVPCLKCVVCGWSVSA